MVLRKGRKRRTGTWSRKGLAKRTKEMWHMPKRASLDQMVGAIKILLDKKLSLNGRPWTSGKQETFNTELAKRGLTESGAPLAPSSRRTFEALLKYLGFIYVDSTTPPSIMQVTKVGVKLIKNPVKTLKLQMAKLQLTNPVVRKDCVKIQVFPFRVTLRLLLEIGPLHYDEIGYILFMHMKKETDYKQVKERILAFRSLPESKRRGIIKRFKKTPEGHVALAKAASVSYYVLLCIGTELCERKNKTLKIRKGKKKTVENLLKKFEGVKTYDFEGNLPLWVEYYGTPNRLSPPHQIPIKILLER